MLDLHMHSDESDGTDSAEQIILKCAKLNLQLSSITDHDTIESQKVAINTAKNKKISYLTGVELSVKHVGELHILGYGMDVFCPRLKKEMTALLDLREERVYSILKELAKHNIKIPYDEVKEYSKGSALGRPHVALALINRGYATSFPDAFNKYLNINGLCYVGRQKLDPKQALEIITNAKGVPVIAHPKFIQTDDIDTLVKELKSYGLMGIEAYYPSHNDKDVEKFCKLAKNNDLIVTIGSDYHGSMRENSAIAIEKRTSPQLKESVDFLLSKKSC